jgi:hypothetical protein
VKNECRVSEDFFVVHALIPVHFTKIPEPLPSDDDELIQLRCHVATKKCTGAYLRAYGSKPISMLGFGPIEATVQSQVGKVYTVEVGGDVSVSVDFGSEVVTYVESSAGTEGRGETSCKAD